MENCPKFNVPPTRDALHPLAFDFLADAAPAPVATAVESASTNASAMTNHTGLLFIFSFPPRMMNELALHKPRSTERPRA
jgi:hypothetical protein